MTQKEGGKPVFSVRIDDKNPVHVRLTVFNRGGNAGQLCVNTADAELLVERIEASVEWIENQWEKFDKERYDIPLVADLLFYEFIDWLRKPAEKP